MEIEIKPPEIKLLCDRCKKELLGCSIILYLLGTGHHFCTLEELNEWIIIRLARPA